MLVQYGIKNFSVAEVTVNEQNPKAKGFYEHLGFKTYKTSSNDEQGNPYPIACMRLKKNVTFCKSTSVPLRFRFLLSV